jgi:hypothetical protein
MAFKALKALCSVFVIFIVAFFGCNPPVVVKQPVVETVPERPIVIIHGDTLVYKIAFADSAERERFIYSFNRFLKETSFLAERFDSAGIYTVLHIAPAGAGQAFAPGTLNTAATGQVLDTSTGFGSLFQEAAISPEDTVMPPLGGAIRLYTPRAFLDYPLSALVEAYPFSERIGNDSLNGYLRVTDISAASFTLQLAQKITSGTGKTMTVLDLVDGWTRYTRERPGEGFSLFPLCQGIADFIKGREAVVRGFVAVDNATIKIKLAKPDPVALDRLRTGRTLPAAFGLGRYAVKQTREGEDVLAPNRSAVGPKPFVNELLVRRGGDPNPMVSFSLGRYDAVLLWNAPDLDYARRNVLKNGTCGLVGRDRYFIAVLLDDQALRAAVRSSLSIAELMNKFVKPEGALIAAIESDSIAGAAMERGAALEMSEQVDPVRVLYVKDDPASKIIAERLLSSVTQKGLKAMLMPADRHAYEAALVDKTPGCYVGWTPETVLTDTSEKLRFETLYWNGDRDEAQRIATDREIPLFSVDWYLLAKDKVGLHKGRLGGIYVKKEP